MRAATMAKLALLGCLVLALTLLCGETSARVQIKDSQIEEWIQNLRPAMMPYIEKKVKEADIRRHKDSDKYLDRELSMFDIIQMFMAEHGSDIDSKIISTLRGLLDGTATAPVDAGALTCANTPQCPPAPASIKEVTRKWRSFTETVQDPASCQPCQDLFSTLVETACETPWETMRDNIINLCENLLFPILDLDPVMCNGTVTLQGQHIYCVVQEASQFDVCESLNLCYPNVTSARVTTDVPVKDRTPWALKKTLEPKLKQEIARKDRKRTKRQTGVVTIVQLTDIHMQPKYTVGAPTDCKAAICCLEDSIARDGTTDARKWGEYSCNVPERTMVKFIEKVNEFSPDFVIYAGDSPPHTLWDETLNSQLNCSNIVVSALRNNLNPGTTVYPAIGNHEMYPTNLYSERMTETKDMGQSFAAMWQDLANFDAEAAANFANMSHFSMLYAPGLRVMSVNSNYHWYTANIYSSLNKYDNSNAQHKSWVESTLAQARASGEKVVIVTHHPVHSGTVASISWWQQVVFDYSDVIVLHVSGHTHSDELDLIIDPMTDECKGVNLVAPTVTTNTNINPSLRVFELDSTTFELLESEVHHFDLEQQNPDVDPNIVLSYNTKTEYGMVDLSPASWQDLVFRFISDETLFQSYYNNKRSQAPTGPCAFDNVCGESCKINTICNIWFPRPDESSECVRTWNYTANSFEADSVVYSGSFPLKPSVLALVILLAFSFLRRIAI